MRCPLSSPHKAPGPSPGPATHKPPGPVPVARAWGASRLGQVWRTLCPSACSAVTLDMRVAHGVRYLNALIRVALWISVWRMAVSGRWVCGVVSGRWEEVRRYRQHPSMAAPMAAPLHGSTHGAPEAHREPQGPNKAYQVRCIRRIKRSWYAICAPRYAIFAPPMESRKGRVKGSKQGLPSLPFTRPAALPALLAGGHHPPPTHTWRRSGGGPPRSLDHGMAKGDRAAYPKPFHLA